ncbi:MAG: DUF4143 domain-containing protein [Propionibacteriaceae bacterium]|jgi:predicted AAA+ superfamily ATPase|nr:DUF4143 domain-containing protein [Propionibacteriaceae bacterium]
MTLTPDGYRERLVDGVVARYLRQFGMVLIEGPKWCGKTWTGQRHANSKIGLADPSGGFAARELALSDPAQALDPKSAPEGEGWPLLVDEWQEAPAVWDAARHLADQTIDKGRFILTGSATPDDTVVHSGAGRAGRVQMRTMSLLESGASTGACSLSSMLVGDRPTAALPAFRINDVIDLVIRGGWPGLPEAGSPDMPGEYLRTLAVIDVPHADHSRKDPRKVMTLLQSLARNSATVVTQKTLVADTGLGDDGKDPAASRSTLARYLTALERLFVIERIPAWSPRLRSRTRLRTSPKTLLTDPSLAVAALSANRNTLLRDLETLGLLFEGLCLRDLAVYAQSIGGRLFHYQDNSGLEADAVIETTDGWCGIEIKLGSHQEDAASATLLRLSEKMTTAGYPPPAFLAVVTGTGATKTRPDGVITASIGALGP